MRCISPKISRNAGFTLVEVMVIAPVVILAIAGLVALIIVLTGDVLRIKGSNDLVYNAESALSQIEQDVKRTTEFRQTSYAPTSPQGQGDNAVAFDTISQTTTHLILRSIATSKNPDSQDRKLIYKQSGGTCSTTPYTFDIVYFTKVTSGVTSLWRRIVFGNTTDAGTPCTGTTPWQAPSCTPGYTPSASCLSEDSLLLENVSAMTVQYLNAAGSQINTTTPNAGSAVRNPNDAAGTTNASSAEVTLTTLNTVAGREGTYTGSILSSAPSKSLGSGGGGGGGSGSNVVTLNYTGAAQTWQVPAGVTSIQIECWGAQGATSAPGLGGYSKGSLAVTPGQTLYIYVGQAGGFASGSGMQFTSTTFNGGGRGTTYNGVEGGGSGGGASDVRTSTTLSTRVIVAGGGGSGYQTSGASPIGGNGGGTNGANGADYPGYPGSAGLGGTQSAGGFRGQLSSGSGTIAFSGALGVGGDSPSNNYGSGGGGGYYGGGGGDNTAGGGGSSYIGGVTSGTTTAGIQSGNGKIVITY